MKKKSNAALGVLIPAMVAETISGFCCGDMLQNIDPFLSSFLVHSSFQL